MWRFDPTISTGSLLQIATLLAACGLAYGTYREDRTRTNMEIDQLKASVLADRLIAKESIIELKQDVRKVQETITSVDKTVSGIKAEIDAKKGKQ